MAMRPLIPMPTSQSPLYVLLTYDAQRNMWTERYTDTWHSIFQLESILRFHCTVKEYGFYQALPEGCEAVYAQFKKGLDKIAEVYQDEFYDNEKAHSDVQTFRNLIIKTTFKYIHLLETCLWHLFIEPFGGAKLAPLEKCLTPVNANPQDIKLLAHSQKRFEKKFRQFFEDKQYHANKQRNIGKPKKDKAKKLVFFSDDEKVKWQEYLKFEVWQVQQHRQKK